MDLVDIGRGRGWTGGSSFHKDIRCFIHFFMNRNPQFHEKRKNRGCHPERSEGSEVKVSCWFSRRYLLETKILRYAWEGNCILFLGDFMGVNALFPDGVNAMPPLKHSARGINRLHFFRRIHTFQALGVLRNYLLYRMVVQKTPQGFMPFGQPLQQQGAGLRFINTMQGFG